MSRALSPLQRQRLTYPLLLPQQFNDISQLSYHENPTTALLSSQISRLFPHTSLNPFLTFKKGQGVPFRALKVGVVLSGGPAPGGHNVLAGLLDALQLLHPDSQLIGFLGGISGLLQNETRLLTSEVLANYRNQGGFDVIGSGRTKIKTEKQFLAAKQAVQHLQLDGLVIVGGDDSNTNAAFLAEYFLDQKIQTRVIGVPKTIDGDLKNSWIEVSFGFDTATKIYSEIIGNLLIDCLSTKKYYYFIKLMGRSASHVTLECALQTHPNLTLIGEEIEENQTSLTEIVHQIVTLICERASQGKNYGGILIPEGLLEFIPEFKQLFQELNEILSRKEESLTSVTEEEKISRLSQLLSSNSQMSFQLLPASVQRQILLNRDAHGNIKVSQIETERFLIELVTKELKERKQKGTYQGHFQPQPLFFGYEGRAGLPSNFDCHYCYALGYVAVLLAHFGKTGYLSCVKNLAQPVENWEAFGLPIVPLMNLEKREGILQPVLRKTLVDLKGPPFKLFEAQRTEWRLKDAYVTPGPIQFTGDAEITESISLTLREEVASSF